jgi:hypothetical protein
LNDVWGEIIKKIGMIAVLTVTLFAAAALAQGTGLFNGPSTDTLAQGISENDGGAFHFPVYSSVNADSLKIGKDKALAFNSPLNSKGIIPKAQNNLEIKKNQQSDDVITLINAEYINIGDRKALAIGSANSNNNVKIVTNQMGSPCCADNVSPSWGAE